MRFDFQPLLSLKGDAQVFKNTVRVRNLSGAKVCHTGAGRSVARDGSTFSLPFKTKNRKREIVSTKKVFRRASCALVARCAFRCFAKRCRGEGYHQMTFLQKRREPSERSAHAERHICGQGKKRTQHLHPRKEKERGGKRTRRENTTRNFLPSNSKGGFCQSTQLQQNNTVYLSTLRIFASSHHFSFC